MHRNIRNNQFVDSMAAFYTSNISVAVAKLMQLDLRDELKNIERPVLTIGAPAQAAPYASFEDTKENYETQMANVPTQFKHMVYAKSAKHFIMVDEPEWIMKQITTFIKSTK